MANCALSAAGLGRVSVYRTTRNANHIFQWCMHTAQIVPLGCAPNPGHNNYNLLRRKRLFASRSASAVSASHRLFAGGAARRRSARGPAVAMPGFGLLLATTAVAVLAFGAVINSARAAYAWFDALVAPEDDQSVSVDDVLRTVWWVLTVLFVPVSSVSWHVLKWLALTGRLILHELVQNIWFAVGLVSLPVRWVSEFIVALQQIFWSTPRSDAAKWLRAEQLAARAKRAANFLGQGGTWPVAAAADSIKGGDTSRPSRRLERASRPSRRLERANSALRALLERRARCAEEAQRAADKEEARARKRRKARAMAIQGWQSMPTGRKLFWICLAVLVAAPRTTTPIAGPTSWLGLQVANEKLQQVMSVNHAMDLLLEYGPEGFQSLYSSGTVSFNLSTFNPDAPMVEVHGVPFNETLYTMESLGALLLGVPAVQISLLNSTASPINPTRTLSSLAINNTVVLHIGPRDRVGGTNVDHGECSSAAATEGSDATEGSAAQPMETEPPPAVSYPPDPGRRRAEEQPAPKEYPKRHVNHRWYCKALVEKEGTGKAKASGKAKVGTVGTFWKLETKEFTGPTRESVIEQREEWITSYLHPIRRGAKAGKRFAPTTERDDGHVKRAATPTSMAEVCGHVGAGKSGPSSEQARPGPGRGHADEPGGFTRLEEPVRFENLKANANWLEQAAARQVRPPSLSPPRPPLRGPLSLNRLRPPRCSPPVAGLGHRADRSA
jgi:hypothetical protein